MRVVLEIQRLAAGAEELKQIEVFNALGLQRLGQALGVRGRAGAGEFRHVLRVERALVRGDGEDKAGAEPLDILGHERKVARRGEELALGERLRAGEVGQLIGVIEPAVRAEHNSALGALAEQRLDAGPEGYQLLTEIKALVQILRRVGEELRVELPVAAEELRLRRGDLVCARRARAQERQTRGRHQAEQEYDGCEYDSYALHWHYAPLLRTRQEAASELKVDKRCKAAARHGRAVKDQQDCAGRVRERLRRRDGPALQERAGPLQDRGGTDRAEDEHAHRPPAEGGFAAGRCPPA